MSNDKPEETRESARSEPAGTLRKTYRRQRKNAAYAVFRLADIYRDGVWWPCYSARPKRKIFKAPDGKEIRMPSTCERWRDVADRLEKSKRQFLAIMKFFGRMYEP